MADEPPQQRHHLKVRLHSAQLEAPAPLAERQPLSCVAEIEQFGRLRTQETCACGGEVLSWQFEEVRAGARGGKWRWQLQPRQQSALLPAGMCSRQQDARAHSGSA